jgi:hypothetical protein
MDKRPIHQNLSTTFVDIEALVRHLRGLQFVGVVHIELCGYVADIIFTANHRIQAREHDRAAGITSQGPDAFRRILIRSREPHGRVDVYQSIGDSRKVHVDAAISARARMAVAGKSDSPASHLIPRTKAKRDERSDWDVLLNLTEELLTAVDRSLGRAGLPFTEAFENACALVAEDCPFIDPNRGLFEYRNGKVRLSTTIARERFLNAVLKALGRIFDHLRDEPELAKPFENAARQLRMLIRVRRDVYETLGFYDGLSSLIAGSPVVE